jgi:hypothetical protein
MVGTAVYFLWMSFSTPVVVALRMRAPDQNHMDKKAVDDLKRIVTKRRKYVFIIANLNRG